MWEQNSGFKGGNYFFWALNAAKKPPYGKAPMFKEHRGLIILVTNSVNGLPSSFWLHQLAKQPYPQPHSLPEQALHK